jgi:hypothetical protein
MSRAIPLGACMAVVGQLCFYSDRETVIIQSGRHPDTGRTRRVVLGRSGWTALLSVFIALQNEAHDCWTEYEICVFNE